MLHHRGNPGTKKKSTGIILVLMAVALPALLAIVGLAIDSARAYGVKANLSAAVDAASLAAARAVSNGEAAAIRAANKFFAANFPVGYFGSTPGQPSVSFSYSAEGDITIDVSATSIMPTTFLKIVGMHEMDVGSTAQTIRRPVDLSFVVDNTTSLTLSGDVTQDVIDRSKEFVGNFGELFDRVALIKYAFGAEVPVGFNNARGFSKATVQSEIDAFEFGSLSSLQYTNASEGMWRAIDALITVNNPASLRVIVFFTDGAPNTFASNFSFNGGVADHVGAIRSGDRPTGTPYGMWGVDKVTDPIDPPWEFRDNRGTSLANALAGFPQYYNAHDPMPADADFLVINPSHPRRPVSNYNRSSDSARDLYDKINRVSRNLPEDMAEYARQNGIFVLTLGLGSRLTQPTGPDGERGDEMLIRMANDPRMQDMPDLASDFRPDQPQGLYCHAVDESALAPCFADMLAVIIRLTL